MLTAVVSSQLWSTGGGGGGGRGKGEGGGVVLVQLHVGE